MPELLLATVAMTGVSNDHRGERRMERSKAPHAPPHVAVKL